MAGLPIDVGMHEIKAYIAASDNYTEVTSEILSLSITPAEGTSNPVYIEGALPALEQVHIVTNLTGTFAEVALPAHWRFTGDTSEPLAGSSDDEGKQAVPVQYTSQDPNYQDVQLDHPFPVSTESISMQSGFAHIATVSGLLGEGVSVRGVAEGLSLATISYQDPDVILGHLLIRVDDAENSSSNTLAEIQTFADALEKLIDREHPAQADKDAVGAVAVERSVAEVEENVPTLPSAFTVVGAATASGAADGQTVRLTATPQPAHGTIKLSLNLLMTVDGAPVPAQSPLFFTLELPENINASRVRIRQVQEDGSTKPIEFTRLAEQEQFISFTLHKLSTLEFVVPSNTVHKDTYESKGDSLTLGRAELERLVNTKNNLTILSDSASVVFDAAALQAVLAATRGQVVFGIKPADISQWANAKALIGARPVLHLTIGSKIDGESSIVPVDFGAGKVTVSLFYTPAEWENLRMLGAVYVDDTGRVQHLADSGYHEEVKAVVFRAPHFSIYGVANNAAAHFKDIADHWAQADIAFAAARGLLGGTDAETFSPDIPMTRGMFVTALGRLSGVDADAASISAYAEQAVRSQGRRHPR